MEYTILCIFLFISVFILWLNFVGDFDFPLWLLIISTVVFVSIVSIFVYVDVFIQPITVETCKCLCDCCNCSS